MPDAQGRKYAIIMSGGGADGAYEIGVFEGPFQWTVLDLRDWFDPRAYLPNPFNRPSRMARDSVFLASEALARAYGRTTGREVSRSYKRVRPSTIHRYYPHGSLSGVLGMLDFSRGSIEERIERGFNDASNYDPESNLALGALASEQEHRLEDLLVAALRVE